VRRTLATAIALTILTAATLAACLAPTAATARVTVPDLCRPLTEPARGDCYRERLHQQALTNAWWAEVRAQQRRARDWNRLIAALTQQARPTGRCYIEGVRVCDGPGLLPYRIVWRESRMNPRARNPRSTAGGFGQVLIGTLRSVCPAEAARYGNAAYLPVATQVECIRRLIARHGLAPWGG